MLKFGAPSHRIEDLVLRAAKELDVEAQILYQPGAATLSFGERDSQSTAVHLIRVSGSALDLGKLERIQQCWLDVSEDRIDIFEAEQQLVDLLAEPPIYPRWMRVGFAFAIAVVICPLGTASTRQGSTDVGVGFGGSFVDAWLSGALSASLAALDLYAAAQVPQLSDVRSIH